MSAIRQKAFNLYFCRSFSFSLHLKLVTPYLQVRSKLLHIQHSSFSCSSDLLSDFKDWFHRPLDILLLFPANIMKTVSKPIFLYYTLVFFFFYLFSIPLPLIVVIVHSVGYCLLRKLNIELRW
jgi:hypothetical protein